MKTVNENPAQPLQHVLDDVHSVPARMVGQTDSQPANLGTEVPSRATFVPKFEEVAAIAAG